MENKAQKKILIIVGVLLVGIFVLAYCLSLFVKDSDPSDKPVFPNDDLDSEVFSKDIVPLEDYNEFFSVVSVINDYYAEIVSKNSKNIWNLLDEDFKELKGVTLDHVFQAIKSDYKSPTFTGLEIYYNKDSVVTYYFVHGYLEDVDITDDNSLYYNSINYLVILNKNNGHYSITPLDDDIDISDYAKNYNLVPKELELNVFKNVVTTDETVLTTYLNIFRDLLFLDNSLAYDMVDLETRKQYSENDFYYHRQEIYDYIPSTVFGYSKKSVDGQTVYSIKDKDQNSFVLYENKVMDFKIKF